MMNSIHIRCPFRRPFHKGICHAVFHSECFWKRELEPVVFERGQPAAIIQEQMQPCFVSAERLIVELDTLFILYRM